MLSDHCCLLLSILEPSEDHVGSKNCDRGCANSVVCSASVCIYGEMAVVRDKADLVGDSVLCIGGYVNCWAFVTW